MGRILLSIVIPNELQSFLSAEKDNIKCEQASGKKAAIFTWCNNNGPTNYGQILQCYAVQHILEGFGYTVKVVYYRQKDSRDITKKYYSNKTAEGRCNNINYEKNFQKQLEGEELGRFHMFNSFVEKYIHLSAPCYSKHMVELEIQDCDLLVCGSDQIWNPAWTNEVLLLNIGKKYQKRVAFAPSGIFVDDKYTNDFLSERKEWFDRFDVITVREKCGAKILQKHVKKQVGTCPDPTLCLSRQEWDEIATPGERKEKYIFCYFIGSVRPYQLMIKEVARKHHVKVIYTIPSNINREPTYSFMEKIEGAGPAEFLSLIKNATAVCTDSFHGLVFSHIYGKTVYCMTRSEGGADRIGRTARLLNLESEYGIKLNLVKNCHDVYKEG